MQYRYAFQISSGRMSCAPRFAYRYVAHRWSSEKHEGEPTIEYFLSIPEDEIRNAKNIGRQTMEYMLRVQRAVQTERQSAQT